MKSFLFVSLFCSMAFAADTAAPADPAAVRIAAAQKAVDATPTAFEPRLELAGALCRKARDSEDIRYFARAEAEVQQALKLAPENYDAGKLEVVIALGRNDLGRALELAKALNKKVPDDLTVWGMLADIYGALGEDAEALRCAQWVLDLRPGNTLGFLTAARLREAHGDLDGAREFYEEARRRVSLNDLEERSWLLSQMARVQLQAGDLKGATQSLTDALTANPQSNVATAGLAKLHLREGDFPAAIALFQKRFQSVNDASTLYDLAEALELGGEQQRAAAAFRDFEARAKAEENKTYNANLKLARYYLSHATNATAALVITKREVDLRHDSATLDAYAWALLQNEHYAEAKASMTRALAIGVRDSTYFCHAGQIAAKLNDTTAAKGFLHDAQALDATSCKFVLLAAAPAAENSK